MDFNWVFLGWCEKPVLLHKSVISEESSVSGQNHWDSHMVAVADDIILKLFMQNLVDILNNIVIS